MCVLPIYKNIVMEVWNEDLNQMEYCHASFHGNYQPHHAFDMELQWVTSTPGLLHDCGKHAGLKVLTYNLKNALYILQSVAGKPRFHNMCNM